MSWFGIGRGIFKVIEGIAEADGEKIFKGVVGTALSAAGEVIKIAHDEQVGQEVSQKGEEMTEDV